MDMQQLYPLGFLGDFSLAAQTAFLHWVGKKGSVKDSRYKLGVKSALFSRRSLGAVQRGVLKASGLHARDFLGITGQMVSSYW